MLLENEVPESDVEVRIVLLNKGVEESDDEVVVVVVDETVDFKLASGVRLELCEVDRLVEDRELEGDSLVAVVAVPLVATDDVVVLMSMITSSEWR